jgi:hypothetical protein
MRSRTVGQTLEAASSFRERILMPPRRSDAADPDPITVVPLDQHDELSSLLDEPPPAMEDPWNFSEAAHTAPQPRPDPRPADASQTSLAHPVRDAAPRREARLLPRIPHEVELPLHEFRVLNETVAATRRQRPRRHLFKLFVAAVAAVVAFAASPWSRSDLRVPAIAAPALQMISQWWSEYRRTPAASSVHVPADRGEPNDGHLATTTDREISPEPAPPIVPEPNAPITLPKNAGAAGRPTATSGPADARGRAVKPPETPRRAVSSQSVAVADDDVEPDPTMVALVRDVLQRFRRAYEEMDTVAVRQVWPVAAEAELARGFDGVQSQRVRFDDCSVRLYGDEASAACRGNVEQTLRTGRTARRVEARVWVFTLRKTGTGWQIETARFTSFSA